MAGDARRVGATGALGQSVGLAQSARSGVADGEAHALGLDGCVKDLVLLALSVRGVAVQLRVAPLAGGCPRRPVSLQRFGVAIVSRGASFTRRGDAERSLRLLRHVAHMPERLPGALLAPDDRLRLSLAMLHRPPAALNS
jgi:hypothetical protein